MTSTEAVERTRAVIRRQPNTIATEQVYLHWLRRYMAALGGMPRTLASEQKLERFLTAPALKKNVWAASQNLAFNDIIFFMGGSSSFSLSAFKADTLKRELQLGARILPFSFRLLPLSLFRFMANAAPIHRRRRKRRLQSI